MVMSDEIAKRHLELIRRKNDEAATTLKAQLVRNDILTAKIPKLFEDLEKAVQRWIAAINAGLKDESSKTVDYEPGTGVEIPLNAFKICRRNFPSVFVTVAVDVKAQIITFKTETRLSNSIPKSEKEDTVILTLDDKNNVIIGLINRSAKQPLKTLTIDQLLEEIVFPIVEALSK
jgi:hypothetical protein